MKLLYNKLTAALHPYPRADDNPVIGLDSCYLEMSLLQQPQPEYDSATHWLEPTEAINLEALTVTRGWRLVALPPPNPVPDWATFRGQLLISEGVAQLMAAARAAGREPAVTALPLVLERAQSGDIAEFAACWALVADAGNPSPELLADLVNLAKSCDLPTAFVKVLQRQ